MKKLLPAAALLVLATSAILAAAFSSHSRANKQLPAEWEKTTVLNADSLQTLQAKILNINK